jgi:hypothetical protein
MHGLTFRLEAEPPGRTAIRSCDETLHHNVFREIYDLVKKFNPVSHMVWSSTSANTGYLLKKAASSSHADLHPGGHDSGFFEHKTITPN